MPDPKFAEVQVGDEIPLLSSSSAASDVYKRQDMANAALFLCSDEAEMITGLCMEVDGGRCI